MTRLLERRLPKRDMAQAGEVSEQPALGGRCARSMPSSIVSAAALVVLVLRDVVATLEAGTGGESMTCSSSIWPGRSSSTDRWPPRGLRRRADRRLAAPVAWAQTVRDVGPRVHGYRGGPTSRPAVSSSEPPRRRRFEPPIRAGAFGYRPLARRRFARPRRSLTFAAMTSGSRHTRPRPRRSPTTRTTRRAPRGRPLPLITDPDIGTRAIQDLTRAAASAHKVTDEEARRPITDLADGATRPLAIEG